MTTPKPLPGRKSKTPIYHKDMVQIYAIVKLKAKGVHNSTEALHEVQKYASTKTGNTKADKKAEKNIIKATLTADEDSLNFKKKGLFGRPPPLKKITYDTVKAFYRFADDPTFLVIGLKGKTGPCHYVVVATSTQEKTVSLVELLQAAQWAPQNNLKNAIPAVDLTKQKYIGDASESSTSQVSSIRKKSLSSSPNPPPLAPSSRLRSPPKTYPTPSSSTTSCPSINHDQPLKSADRRTPSPSPLKSADCRTASLSPLSLPSSLRTRESPTFEKELSMSSALSSRSSSVINAHLPLKGSSDHALFLSEGKSQYVAVKSVKPKSKKGRGIGEPKTVSHTKHEPEKSGIFLFTNYTGKPSHDDSQPNERKLSSRLYYRSDNGEFITDNGSEKAKRGDKKLRDSPSYSRSDSSSSVSSSTSSRNDLQGNEPPVYWIK